MLFRLSTTMSNKIHYLISYRSSCCFYVAENYSLLPERLKKPRDLEYRRENWKSEGMTLDKHYKGIGLQTNKL